MELRDKALQAMEGGRFYKNRLVLTIGGLVGLGIIAVVALLLFLLGVLPPGRSAATLVAQATSANTTAAATSETPTPTETALPPTPAETPVAIPSVTPQAMTTPGSSGGAAEANPVLPNPLSGLYAAGMRVVPAKPHKGELISFRVTLVNASGHTESHNICAEIFRPGESKSFGITSCLSQTIPPGTSQATTGNWKLTGIYACMAIRARPVVRDEGENRLPLPLPSGDALWLDTQVCP